MAGRNSPDPSNSGTGATSGAASWSRLAAQASDTNLVEAPGPDVILWPWELFESDEKRLAANHDRVVKALFG